jgi:hypothetical protein
MPAQRMLGKDSQQKLVEAQKLLEDAIKVGLNLAFAKISICFDPALVANISEFTHDTQTAVQDALNNVAGKVTASAKYTGAGCATVEFEIQ